MKILLFAEIYDCGGADTFIFNLINNWPDPEDEFILVTNSNYPGLAIIEKNLRRSCKIVRHSMKLHYNFINSTGRLKNILRVLSPIVLFRYAFLVYNIIALRRILLGEDPDRLMVINGGYPGGDSCRAAGISWGLFSGKSLSVHNFHNLVNPPVFFLRPHEYIIDRLLGSLTRAFVTVSKASADSMSIRPVIYKRKITGYIHNGIDDSCYREAKYSDLRSELGIPEKCPMCLILATYEPRKGHYFLFNSFRLVLGQVPGAHLLVCGYSFPNELKQVQKYVKELDLGENVHLMDFRDDISNLLSNIDVLVVSSQSFESFGFTSVEAMAHKVPVVATNVGGIPEVVENDDGGYCVDHKDVEEFAAHIVRLLKDEGLRKAQGEKGFLRYRKHFTARRMAGEYAELIKGR